MNCSDLGVQSRIAGETVAFFRSVLLIQSPGSEGSGSQPSPSLAIRKVPSALYVDVAIVDPGRRNRSPAANGRRSRLAADRDDRSECRYRHRRSPCRSCPVVMAHAETASVADRSLVVTPSATVAALGVCMNHWPLAVRRRHETKDRPAAHADSGADRRRRTATAGSARKAFERRVDVGAVQSLLQEQHVHARRQLPRAAHRHAGALQPGRRRPHREVWAWMTLTLCGLGARLDGLGDGSCRRWPESPPPSGRPAGRFRPDAVRTGFHSGTAALAGRVSGRRTASARITSSSLPIPDIEAA